MSQWSSTSELWSYITAPPVVTVSVLVATVVVVLLLTAAIRRSGDPAAPLRQLLAGIRNFIVPLALGWFLLTDVVGVSPSSVPAKIAGTLFWMTVVWVGTAIVKITFFGSVEESSWRARVPGLLINLVQVSLILIAAALVIARVWNQNLGGLLATLGVTSIVVGLALQDTLGNLFAGIALLSEMPFSKGDWIGVGDLQGRVVNINWRAVHLITRERDLRIVPNSVLGKEIIKNYTRPTKAHGVIVHVGFSYDDPPNEVKKMLRAICDDVPDISPGGISVRTLSYGDFAINYEVRYFIDGYLREPEIREDFMTRIWYATRRHGFTIPFPIRTVHTRTLPPAPVVDRTEEVLETLRQLPLFNELSPEELDTLRAGSSLLEFAGGDSVVREGQPGDSMYLIRSGRVVVKRSQGQRSERTLAELQAGAYFGEMSMLTGEPRSAAVVAKTDTVALMVPAKAVQAILTERPKLVESLAADVEERRKAHDDPTEFMVQVGADAVPGLGGALVDKIRQFFRLPDSDKS